MTHQNRCHKEKLIIINHFSCNNTTLYMWISLGGTCAVANYLHKSKQAMRSPFDWCKMDIKALNSVIKNNFNRFSDLIVIRFSENHQYIDDDSEYRATLHSGSLILQNPYGISFAHQILEKDMLSPFIQRLNQRIQHFKDINRDNDLIEVTFVRFEAGKLKSNYMQDIIELIGLLSTIVKSFKLILIIHMDYQHKLDMSLLQNMPIKLILYNSFDSDWRYPEVFKEDIF